MRPTRAAPLLLALMVPMMLGTASAPAHANADAPACTIADEATVAGVFGRLNGALAARRAEETARVFLPDAALLPPGSDMVRSGREEIRRYFEQLLARFPQGTVTSRSIEAGCNRVVESGTYVWRLTGQRMGTRMLVHGRFNTEYVFRDGAWLIARHTATELPPPPLALRYAGGARAASRTTP